MYAIVENGGRQYKVSPGDTIKVEKIPLNQDKDVILDKVLLVKKDDINLYGSPYVNGAKVIATVEKQGKQRKIIIFKQRPRKGYRNMRGHRQPFTSLKIKEIVTGG